MTVALDAVTATSAASVASPFTFTHTPVGTPTAVGVFVAVADNGSNITGATYGGVPMTLATSAAFGVEVNVFGLANPPPGPQTVSISYSPNPFSIVAAAVTVTGSSLTTCFSATNNLSSGGGTGNPQSLSVASANGELVVDIFAGYVTGAVTPGPSPQVQQWNIPQGNQNTGGSSVNATGPTTTQWTMTSDNFHAYCIASFMLAPSGGQIPSWAEVILGG